jgi:DivIVA domain-containing protein
MGPKEIMSRKFEMVLRGFKTEEVEDYLREVSLEMSRIIKENEDLEKKLEVLANKIREYREDEDTLKDALLGAQRQGNALIADSKRKAAEIIEETEAKRDEMLKKAENDRQKLQEKGESQIAAAQEEARDIISKAEWKASDIENEMNLRTEVQKEILFRTSSEIIEFKKRVVASYQEQISTVEQISERCENEFISDLLKEPKPDPAKVKDRKNKNKKPEPGKGKPVAKSAVDFFEESSDSEQSQVSDAGANPLEGGSVAFDVDVTTELAALSKEFAESEDFVGEYSDDEVIEMNLDAIIAENNADGETGEVPLFPSKSDNKKTSEIYFKKSGGKGKSKLHFGVDNPDNE